MSTNPNLDAALSLASMFHIFPCTPNKKPTVQAWEQNATDNGLKIEATWRSNPALLPAIPVGAHGLVVVDCDRKNGIDGVAAFTALCTAHSVDLSTAFVVETPSTGLHFYFRADAAYGNSRGQLPAGIDVRGIGGYVIGPGAAGYRIVQGSLDTVPALPAALAALLRPKVDSFLPMSPQAPYSATERERAYAENALTDELEKLSVMREGQGRNAALNGAAKRLGEMAGAGWIERAAVEQTLWEASEQNGYRAKDGDGAAWATLQSGLSAGLAQPRSPLPVLDIPQWIPGMLASWIEAYKAKRQTAAKPARASGLTLLFGNEIQERAIEWLWDQYLPMGSLILLAGNGGVGKSTITCDIAARVTNGALWPDGSPCRKPGKVLIWSSEDDPARVIKPRLMAAGANPNNYAIVGPMIDERGEKRSFDPACDMNALRSAVEQIGGISLLIIDPIVSAVTGDMNKVNEVRRSLQAIVDFGASVGCAVIGITHFAKGTAGRIAAERVIGSTAFKDLSRVTIAVAKDEESGEHVFTRAKSNYSAQGDGFNFSIEVIGLHNGIQANRISWGQPLQGSARAILAKVEGDGNDEGEKLQVAKKYLIEVLSNGPTPAKELIKHASEGYGIKEDTLRRAFTALSGFITRSGFGKGSVSMWSLPIANMPH